jgi:hypothetical protein
VEKFSELIGLSAVVITLVFVGFELRQYTRAVESSATREVHANFSSWYASLQRAPELLLTTVKGMQDYSALNTAEKAQSIGLFMVFSSNCQTAFYKWRDGLLDEELSFPYSTTAACGSEAWAPSAAGQSAAG